MKYLSVCSGIEAASVAWHPLGWEAFAYSEIEKFPSKVLAHHYSNTPNLGDMTNYKEWPHAAINVLVGGTPCQSFSIAGLRKGLDDPRGNLMLTYLAIAAKYRPQWLVWENVPGVLSSNGGQDFASLLRGLAELGYGFAYRVLDAQHFGVPQRRRRVFVIGCLGDWRSAAAVLFERHSLQGHPAQSRNEGQEVAGTFTSRAKSGGWGTDVDLASGGYMRTVPELATTLVTKTRLDTETETFIPTYAFGWQNSSNQGDSVNEYISPTLDKSKTPAIAYGVGESHDLAHCLRSGASKADKHESTTYIQQSMQVRRLTPLECERLQGFPDGYTDIPGASDSTRYKALGNSMAVPVMNWLGQRINMVESIDR